MIILNFFNFFGFGAKKSSAKNWRKISWPYDGEGYVTAVNNYDTRTGTQINNDATSNELFCAAI